MIILISPRSKSKQIAIKTDFDPRVGDIWMDYEKMKQVILNILSNAVDFTPEGGLIEILTRNHSEKGGRDAFKIEIRDNGCGIPSDMLNKVFDPYVTTKHKSDMHSGTGLGLFIAHQIMQDHGGGIEIQSGRGDGTRVTLTLPSDPPRSSNGSSNRQETV
jgi:signal transduction histidine kinase